MGHTSQCSCVVYSLIPVPMANRVIAQLGHPDMRTPIAQALAYPERIDAGVPSLDLFRIGSLDFERPDFERFRVEAFIPGVGVSAENFRESVVRAGLVRKSSSWFAEKGSTQKKNPTATASRRTSPMRATARSRGAAVCSRLQKRGLNLSPDHIPPMG